MPPLYQTRERIVPSFVTQAPRSSQKYEVFNKNGSSVADHADGVWSPPCDRKTSNGALSNSTRSSKSTGRRKTLIIDLDETLIHSVFEPCASDMQVPMIMDGHHYTAYVMVRPGCAEFMKKAVEQFDVVIWTASLECYAGGVIDRIEQICNTGRLKRMFRESCTKFNGSYVKDLRKLGVNLHDIAILDNSPHVAALQPRNLINIKNFYDDKRDRALFELLPFLDRLDQGSSVYDVLRK